MFNVLERPDKTATDSAEGDLDGFVSESFGARFRRDAYATAHLLRRPLMPHAVTAAVLGGGLGVHAIVASGSMAATPAAFMLGTVAYPVALIAGQKVRQKAPRWSARTRLAGLAAATWLTLAPFGVDLGSVSALVAGEFALAAGWWQAVRIGYPGVAEPEIEAVVQEEIRHLDDVEQIVADWRDYVGCNGGPLPASALRFPEKTEYGHAFDLRLARAKQTITQAHTVIDKIADGLGVGVEDLVLEPHPTIKAPGMCRLQVLTGSPISGDVNFDGPRRTGGPGYALLGLGPYADGQGEATWRLYTPGSMWSGVIIGGTGSGKSRIIENIAISAMSGGDTVIWFVDPQNGVGSPALAEHADWFGNTATADKMLDAAIAILDGRGEESAYEGWIDFTPSPQRPGLLIVIDESHNILKTRPKEWSRLVQEGRKLGLAVVVIDQYPGLETFGNHEPMRSSVMEGNAVVTRSTSNQTGQLMAGISVDPKLLPKIPGYGYIQGSAETGTRTAPFRNRNTGKSAGEWLAAQPKVTLDTLAATCTLAAGTHYRDRHLKSAAAGRVASASRIEQLRGGHLPAEMLVGTPQEQSTAPDLKVVVFPDFADHRAAIEAEETAHAARADRASAAAVKLTDTHRAVLAAIENGIDRPKDLQEAVDRSARQVQTLLSDLIGLELIAKADNYGRYQIAS